MSIVQFIKGPKSSYNASLYPGGIFFATDEKVIYVDGISYGAKPESVRAVADVVLSGSVLTISYTQGEPKQIELADIFTIASETADGLMSAQDKKNLDALSALLNEEGIVELSTSYQSGIEDTTLAMPTAVGGFAAGTTVGQLNGKSYNEMFDDLLFPSVNPSHGTPSLTGFALNPSTTPVEIGTAVASISEAGLNKSTWTTYNNSLSYAGDITSTVYTIKINGTEYSDITALPEKYTTLGSQTYKAVVNYGVGPVPVNNKGVAVESLACPASNVSATRTVNVTCPWFASTVTAGELTKQSLVSWNATAGAMSTGEFTVMPHTAEAPQMFKVPRVATLLQMYNTVAKAFETVSLSDWTKTEVEETVNGVEHTYYTYTYNGSNRGSVKLIVKF